MVATQCSSPSMLYCFPLSRMSSINPVNEIVQMVGRQGTQGILFGKLRNASRVARLPSDMQYMGFTDRRIRLTLGG